MWISICREKPHASLSCLRKLSYGMLGGCGLEVACLSPALNNSIKDSSFPDGFMYNSHLIRRVIYRTILDVRIVNISYNQCMYLLDVPIFNEEVSPTLPTGPAG